LFIPNLIHGQERASRSGDRFDNVDPWTQESSAEVALSGAADAADAVSSAREAFDDGRWSGLPTKERLDALYRLADLVESNGDGLAAADTRDMGNPISGTKGTSAPRAALNFRFFADFVRLRGDDSFPREGNELAYTKHEAAGVVVAVGPWNYPLIQETWKVAPALAWGNTVVLKPSEETPTSALLLGRLALEAGIPPGVFNVVQGFGAESVGEALTKDSRVDRITFTGEVATGRAISAAAARNLTPVSLELGGKGASVVFGDADLDTALPDIVRAGFMNSGQVCLAGSRVYVERRVFDEVCDRLTDLVGRLKIGDPMDPSTDIGPLSSAAHFQKVKGYLDRAHADGGKFLAGGAVGDGLVIPPALVVNLPGSSAVCREEVFGPLMTLSTFDDEAEAVALANCTAYGLTTSVFTTDLGRAHRVAASVRAGTVWVNCFAVRELRAPFGGMKDSGVGREGGDHSREFFSEPKTVIVRYGS